MLYLTKVTEPDTEPITVDTLSAHLRLNDTEWEEDLLAGWIKAARQDFEARTQRALVSCTFKLGLERWKRLVYLPRGPVSAVSSVKYYTPENVLTTVNAGDYILDTSRDMAMVRFLKTFVAPATSTERVPIEINFTAGYGASESSVPQLIKQGITLLAAEMYRSREALTDKTLTELPYGYQSIVNLYKLNFASELNE